MFRRQLTKKKSPPHFAIETIRVFSQMLLKYVNNSDKFEFCASYKYPVQNNATSDLFFLLIYAKTPNNEQSKINARVLLVMNLLSMLCKSHQQSLQCIPSWSSFMDALFSSGFVSIRYIFSSF